MMSRQEPETTMPFLILALFIVVPLAEIAVFIAAGEAIGLLPTIITVIVTAVIGTYLLQRQGLSAMARTQEAMAAGQMPVESIVDGIYLLVAGALLLTPGFITDGVGFLLFVPPVRRWLAKHAFRYVMRNADIHVTTTGSRPDPRADSTGPVYDDGQGPIIDGEFEHMDQESPSHRRGKSSTSPWRDPNKQT